MKRSFLIALILLLTAGIAVGLYFSPDVKAGLDKLLRGDEPDLPDFASYKVNKEEFMTQRAEQLSMYRGIHKDVPFNPQERFDAIAQMERQEADLAKNSFAPLAAWTELGPNPIPNAQVGTAPSTAASGRVLSIDVHPTNPDIVYVGTAQGGLYRSTNGGGTWTPLLENALSLAVNTVAISPSNPETIFVGTGESGFCGDCFFGAGVYRITNASTTADLSPAFGATTTFAGRSISKIVVHPTNPDIIFVTSSSGSGGIGGQVNNVLATRGVFRSTDATSAAPTFTKLTVAGPAAQDRAYGDMVMDPGNPDRLLVALVDTFGLAEGGVYLSTNALSATPTFARTFATTGTGSNASRTELALHRNTGTGVVTVYAASAEGAGTVQRSVDGGATWTQRIDNNFCSPQCFYDIAVDVAPNNADSVYVGGSPTLVFGRSADGGTTFTANGANFTAGLHVDSHAIKIAPSNPSIAYFGSDGGIYRTNDVNATPIAWTSLSNTTFRATQFMSLALHGTDPTFSIGGTQDNGTNYYSPAATWLRVDGGDGGFTIVDQTDTVPATTEVFHTYFNQTTLQGYGYSAAGPGGPYAFRGCQAAGATVNGITCTGSVLFYAPLEQGPPVAGSLGNTIYYGSDRLYRSQDSGTTHTVVSQNPITAGVPISAIGISPQNDNVRVVGQANGGIFGTTTGAATLTDMDPTNAIPNNYIGRVAVDPLNVNTAYVTIAAFGVTNVWKTTTLNSFAESNVAPTWTASNTGLPAVPVNAFAIDPINSTRLYAGTDIGVYTSPDSGARWFPLGTGLPRVAVFDIGITVGAIGTRQVRIATHGRGLWQTPEAVPTAAEVSVSGRVLASDGRGVTNARVTLSGPNGQVWTIVTGRRGTFSFDTIPAGETYVLSVGSRRFQYEPRVLSLNDSVSDIEFYPTNNDRQTGKKARP